MESHDNEMRAVLQYDVGKVRFGRVPVPEVKNDEVLIKVNAAGLCGSDLHRRMSHYPLTPGHEIAGEVCRVGCDVASLAVGDHMVVAPLVPCYRCEYCRRGQYVHCRHYRYVGSSWPGGFAEYCAVPAQNALKIDGRIPWHIAALVEPATVAFHAVERSGMRPGDTVVILGAGTIGLLLTKWSRLLGAGTIITTDTVDERLEAAKGFGASVCVNVREKDVCAQIQSELGADGADVVFEAVGAQVTQRDSLEYVRHLGRVIWVGMPDDELVLPARLVQLSLRKEIMLTTSWGPYSNPFPGREWHVVLSFIETGRLQLDDFPTASAALEGAELVYELAQSGKIWRPKILFRPDLPAEESEV